MEKKFINIPNDKLIFIAQVASFLLMWIFVLLVTIWLVNLLMLSIELKDSPGASILISFVAIPVFVMIASILTYVFIGLQKEERRIKRGQEEG